MTQNRPVLRWHSLPSKKRPQTGLLCAAFRAVGECEMSHPPAPPRVTPPAARGRVHTTPCLAAGGSPRKEGGPPTSPGSLWPLSLVVGSNRAPKTKGTLFMSRWRPTGLLGPPWRGHRWTGGPRATVSPHSRDVLESQGLQRGRKMEDFTS